MTTTIRPTRQAVRVHRSHLATTHRAPLVPRRTQADGSPSPGARAPRATAFTPMAREPLTDETPRHPSLHHES
ncbi:hypothetical protein N865_09080 [Intrasporangium oryzae NRRL B-24470]|uniref:Uncharacterized protein n=1 Tax=Intrasporangium oryzae NRRL B-24470 TaxID=1386089 RepID=W9GFS6_9MICO|nr:hypothetical protein [Intrasporangium oryzae]EWT03688.1 hypothetical protein N865_09080 [Intrasporangium oryzae NRRL B-24470]